MTAKITFHRAYKGGYSVKNNGKLVDYIDRSCDGIGWQWRGQLFGRLSEAKAEAAAEITGE